jgi:DNA-directed RNA polymerase subunit N (RpoN/RPB10)
MPIYTICGCGMILSDKRDYFLAMKQKYENEKNPENTAIQLMNLTELKLEKLLDDLGLKLWCCRAKMIAFDESDPYIIFSA